MIEESGGGGVQLNRHQKNLCIYLVTVTRSANSPHHTLLHYNQTVAPFSLNHHCHIEAFFLMDSTAQIIQLQRKWIKY